jgi:hypothetical protein
LPAAIAISKNKFLVYAHMLIKILKTLSALYGFSFPLLRPERPRRVSITLIRMFRPISSTIPDEMDRIQIFMDFLWKGEKSFFRFRFLHELFSLHPCSHSQIFADHLVCERGKRNVKDDKVEFFWKLMDLIFFYFEMRWRDLGGKSLLSLSVCVKRDGNLRKIFKLFEKDFLWKNWNENFMSNF